jgi:hypothetical protein
MTLTLHDQVDTVVADTVLWNYLVASIDEPPCDQTLKLRLGLGLDPIKLADQGLGVDGMFDQTTSQVTRLEVGPEIERIDYPDLIPSPARCHVETLAEHGLIPHTQRSVLRLVDN